MKNLVTAGVVAAALALTCLSQQRASAQCCPPQCMRGGDISLNAGISFGCHWTPCHGHWEPNCCGPYGCPFGPYGYAGAPPYGYPPQGYAAAPFAAPQPKPAAPAAPSPKEKKETEEVQNVGYAYPAAYGYGYDNGYWYGYPYYQDQGYWYGYGR